MEFYQSDMIENNNEDIEMKENFKMKSNTEVKIWYLLDMVILPTIK